MKKTIKAKIGTRNSTILVLWNDKPINIGGKIIAMKSDLYNSLHWSYRKLRKCNYWEEFYVIKTEPILFLSK